MFQEILLYVLLSYKEVYKMYNELRAETEKRGTERQEILTKRGKKIKPRRHHSTDKKKEDQRQLWLEDIYEVSEKIRIKGGERFFNPYRQAGIYYGQVKALFCLGANEWHCFYNVFNVAKENMSKIEDKNYENKWKRFENKSPRKLAISAKDEKGRFMDNLKVMQRLGGRHPYGLKLSEVGACIDIRKTDSSWSYRLRTTFDQSAGETPIYIPIFLEGEKREISNILKREAINI